MPNEVEERTLEGRSGKEHSDAPQGAESVGLAALHGIGRALDALGVRASLQEASLVRAARRRTGLEFFGEEAFRVPLRILLHGLEHEARLHPVGRVLLRSLLVRSLASRLRLQALRDLRPETFQIDVDRPIFIVGLQGAGGTFLQRLLAKHPSLRALRAWEASNPVPFEAKPRFGSEDPRRAVHRSAEKRVRYVAPDLQASDPVVAELREEDARLFDTGFFTPTFEALANVPSFSRWLVEADDRCAYEDYRSVIQVLLSQQGGRWVGRAAFHLEHLGALLTSFPDARIVHTHRDPLETLAAQCRVREHLRGAFSDEADPHEVGHQWLARTHLMLTRGLADRARHHPDLFLDVHYDDLVADPMKQVERICDFADAPLPEEARSAIEASARAQPEPSRPQERHALEDFGLEVDSAAEYFREYRERFGL